MVMTGLTRGSACVVLLWTGDKKIIYGLEDSFFFFTVKPPPKMEKIISKKYFTSKQTQLSKH